MSDQTFPDRRTAGLRLAEAVSGLMRDRPELADPVILALPRGGVPVALEIARQLRAPLDLVMVRKIGVPWQPELAAAAIVNGDAPQLVVNRDIVRQAGISEAALEEGKQRELAEIARRRSRYLGDRSPVPVEGRDAIVVDDGVATGATTRAALLGVRRRQPRSLTLAVPVAPREALTQIAREVDHVVCLATQTPSMPSATITATSRRWRTTRSSACCARPSASPRPAARPETRALAPSAVRPRQLRACHQTSGSQPIQSP